MNNAELHLNLVINNNGKINDVILVNNIAITIKKISHYSCKVLKVLYYVSLRILQ